MRRLFDIFTANIFLRCFLILWIPMPSPCVQDNGVARSENYDYLCPKFFVSAGQAQKTGPHGAVTHKKAE